MIDIARDTWLKECSCELPAKQSHLKFPLGHQTHPEVISYSELGPRVSGELFKVVESPTRVALSTNAEYTWPYPASYL